MLTHDVFDRNGDGRISCGAETRARKPKRTTRFAFLSVAKGTVSPGQIIHILRSGGDVDLPDRIQRSREPGFPAFQKGRDYVLFLKWNGALTMFDIVYGPNGAFAVSAGAISAIGKASLSTAQTGKPLGEFIDEIKSISTTAR